MELRLLGPVEAYHDGHPVDLGRRRERLLLALLLLDPGKIVPVDRLISLLWEEGEQEPPTARRSLQVHVSRLRHRLRSAGPSGPRLTTRGRGYVIDIDPDSVDVHRFRAVVAQARLETPSAQIVARLREVLELWRGPALSGVASEKLRERLAAGLEELRLSAYELLFEAELSLARHEFVVTELIDLVERNPTRERLVGQLLTTLHRLDRVPDALNVYRRTRERIVEELGLEPGVQLRQLHEALLRSEPTHEPEPIPVPRRRVSEPVLPAQLPAPARGFTGRAAEIAELDRLASGDAQTGPASIIAVVGAPGIGKTSLAIHWAHHTAGRFPDGQLFTNLHGYDPSRPAARPIDAIACFLRALGVAPSGIPIEVEEATALFRSLIAGRRMLIVIDNAASADPVRALLPGTHQNLVLVTSRDALTGLVAREGARRLTLDPLSGKDADGLLAQVIGHQRVLAEREQCAELVRACGNLPLALRIAAANVYSQPDRSIAEQLAMLRSAQPLSALEIENDATASVRMAFDQSFEALGPEPRELLCLLGLAPGLDFTVETVIALTGQPPKVAQHRLGMLADAHLVQASTPGRYEMHDLLRLYARERAADECDVASRSNALQQLYRDYQSKVDSAAILLYPQMLRLPSRALPSQEFADSAEAASWLEAEQANLVEAVAYAAEHGMPGAACLLADAMRGALWLRRNINNWMRVGQSGLEAAQALNDSQASAAAMISLAHAQHCAGRYEAAADLYGKVLELSREVDWLQAQATALGNLAVIRLGMGDLRQTIELCQKSIAIHQELGLLSGEAVNVGTLGLAYLHRGELREAYECLTTAVSLHRKTSTPSMLMMSLCHVGEACRELAEVVAARRHLDEAVELAGQIGHRSGEAVARHYLAMLHLDLGEPDEAQGQAEKALAISHETNNSFNMVYALIALGSVHHARGDALSAVAAFQEALQVSIKSVELHPRAVAFVALASGQLLAGDLVPALENAAAGLGLARKLEYRVVQEQACFVLAATKHRLGDEAAAASLTDGAEIAGSTGRRSGFTRGE